MALRNCRDCGTQVSTQAVSCPSCGAPYPWQRHLRGPGYEWRSSVEVLGIPLVHIAWGRTPEGRMRVAKGIIAIGQFGIGVVTIAQFGIGLLFGLGQFMAGTIAVGQMAVGVQFGLGQLATGYTAIGQMAVGHWALGQIAFGDHVWSTEIHDLAARAYFAKLPVIGPLLR